MILDDNSLNNSFENESNSLTGIVNERNIKKKKTTKSKYEQFCNNTEKFYNSDKNSLNLANIRNYFVSQTNRKIISTFEENPDKMKFHERNNNFFDINKYKNISSSIGCRDNISVASSEKSSNINLKIKNNQNKINIKKNCIKNHNIQDFFSIANINKEKEEIVLKSIMKLFTNEKYNKLLEVFENNREILSSISSYIYQYTEEILSDFNIINEEIINLEKNKLGHIDIESEFLFYLDSNTKFDFQYDLENSFKQLINSYTNNVVDFINVLFNDNCKHENQIKNIDCLNDNEKMKNCIDRLIITENIVKSFIKLSESIVHINMEISFEKLNLSNMLNSNVKELFIFFLQKMFMDNDNIKNCLINNKIIKIELSQLSISSDILIKRIGVFILILENFISIQNKIISKISNSNDDNKRREIIKKKFSNDLNLLINQFHQFLLLSAFLTLIKIYGLDFSEINIKKFDRSKLNQNYEYISLLKIICETYFKIDFSKKMQKQNEDSLDNCLYVLKEIFNEYLLKGFEKDSNPDFDFENNNSNLNNNKNIKKEDKLNKDNNSNIAYNFLLKMKFNFNNLIKNVIYENVVNKDILRKSLNSTLYKIFICLTNNILDPNNISNEIKKFIHNKPVLDLYRRYINILLLTLFDGNFKNSKLTYFEELYEKNICIPESVNRKEKINVDIVNSYYDLENVVRNINSAELKTKVNLLKKSNLINEYLISDLNTLIIIEKYWKIESTIIIKNIFTFFNILNSKHLRIIESDSLKLKKNIYKLIDCLFKNDKTFLEKRDSNNILDSGASEINNSIDIDLNNDEYEDFYQTSFKFPTQLEFIYKITRLVRKILTASRDEKNIKKILSKFVNSVSNYLNKNYKIYEDNILEYNIPKLNSISLLSIAFSFIEFANFFDNKEEIESCFDRLKAILDFQKSTVFIKGINIAVSINIILNYSRKNINLSEPIKHLNNHIKYMYNQIDLNNKKKLSNNINHDLNVNILQNEIFPTLHFLLNHLYSISKDKSNIFIENPLMLDELKNFLIYNFKIAINYKQIIINILNNCLSNCEDIIKNNLRKNAKIEDNDIHIYEIPIDLLLEEEIKNNDFLILVHRDFLDILINLIPNLIIENQSNSGSLSQTLSLPFLKSVTELITKICAVLYKYGIISYSVFNQRFGIKSIFFASKLRDFLSYNPKNTNQLNIINAELLDNITLIPFNAFSVFIKMNNDLIKNEISCKKDKDLFIDLLKILFYALFYNVNYQNYKLTYDVFAIMKLNSDNKNTNCFDNLKRETEVYIIEFIKIIEDNKNLIQSKINELKVDSNYNGYNKSEIINIYNLILFFCDDKIKDMMFNIKDKSSNLFIIFEILFEEFVNNDDFPDYRIDMKLINVLFKELDEIISRGISLENMRKNKNLFQNSFDMKNFCFNIINFYFNILNSVASKKPFQESKANNNQILFEFIRICMNTLDRFISDYNFIDLSNKNIGIGYSLFKFCGENIKININHINDYKRENNYFIFLDKSINHLIDRMKNNFEYIFETNDIIKLDNKLKNFQLDFSQSFSYDFYHERYHLNGKISNKANQVKIINGKLHFNNDCNHSVQMQGEIIKLKNRNKFVKLDELIQSSANLNNEFINDIEEKNSKQKNKILIEVDDEILDLNLDEDDFINHEIVYNKNENNQNLNSVAIHKNNNLITKREKIIHTQNLENFTNSYLNLCDEEINNLYFNRKNEENRYFNFIDPKIQNYVESMIQISSYLSSDKFLYENSFSSKNYYFYVLFIFNEIIQNFNEYNNFLINVKSLMNLFNFRKYPIHKLEDFYLNSFIINLLDLVIDSLVNENSYLNIEPDNFDKYFSNNKRKTKKSFDLNEIIADFKLFDYIYELLNFISKYTIETKRLNKKGDLIIRNIENSRNDNYTDKKIYWVNKKIESNIKNIFIRKCVEYDKNNFNFDSNDDKRNMNSLNRFINDKQGEIVRNVIISLEKITKNLRIASINNYNIYPIKPNKTINKNPYFDKKVILKLIENIDASLSYFSKIYLKTEKISQIIDISKENIIYQFPKIEYSLLSKKYFKDFEYWLILLQCFQY